jgi:hypothetical protein
MAGRAVLVVLAGVATAAVAAAVALASYPKPPTGAWSLNPGGSFKVVGGHGKRKNRRYVKAVHLTSAYGISCPEKPVNLRVLGRFPLVKFTRGGYVAWGVGRNAPSSPDGYLPVAAKLVVRGHKVNGKFDLVFAYDNVRQVLGGDVRVKLDGANCLAQVISGHPKH